MKSTLCTGKLVRCFMFHVEMWNVGVRVRIDSSALKQLFYQIQAQRTSIHCKPDNPSDNPWFISLTQCFLIFLWSRDFWWKYFNLLGLSESKISPLRSLVAIFQKIFSKNKISVPRKICNFLVCRVQKKRLEALVSIILFLENTKTSFHSSGTSIFSRLICSWLTLA